MLYRSCRQWLEFDWLLRFDGLVVASRLALLTVVVAVVASRLALCVAAVVAVVASRLALLAVVAVVASRLALFAVRGNGRDRLPICRIWYLFCVKEM